MNGLICSILQPKDIGNCSNGGLSATCSKVTVLGVKYNSGEFKSMCNVFSPGADAPAVVIVERMIYGESYFTAYPCDADGKPFDGWYMFGGCFIESSDSRFHDFFTYPVPLHDRQEKPVFPVQH